MVTRTVESGGAWRTRVIKMSRASLQPEMDMSHKQKISLCWFKPLVCFRDCLFQSINLTILGNAESKAIIWIFQLNITLYSSELHPQEYLKWDNI